MAFHHYFRAKMAFMFSFSRMNMSVIIHLYSAVFLSAAAMVTETGVTCNSGSCLDSACNSEMNYFSASEQAEEGTKTSRLFSSVLKASTTFQHENFSVSPKQLKACPLLFLHDYSWMETHYSLNTQFVVSTGNKHNIKRSSLGILMWGHWSCCLHFWGLDTPMVCFLPVSCVCNSGCGGWCWSAIVSRSPSLSEITLIWLSKLVHKKINAVSIFSLN